MLPITRKSDQNFFSVSDLIRKEKMPAKTKGGSILRAAKAIAAVCRRTGGGVWKGKTWKKRGKKGGKKIRKKTRRTKKGRKRRHY